MLSAAAFAVDLNSIAERLLALSRRVRHVHLVGAEIRSAGGVNGSYTQLDNHAKEPLVRLGVEMGRSSTTSSLA